MKLATITMSLLAAPTYLLDILLDLTTVALLEILLGPPMSLLRCRAPSAPEPPRARRTSSPAAIRGTRRGRLGQTITPTARFLQETEPGWLIWKPRCDGGRRRQRHGCELVRHICELVRHNGGDDLNILALMGAAQLNVAVA